MKILAWLDYSFSFVSNKIPSMFMDRKVSYSAVFTFLVRWHICAVSFTLHGIIFAQLACPPE